MKCRLWSSDTEVMDEIDPFSPTIIQWIRGRGHNLTENPVQAKESYQIISDFQCRIVIKYKILFGITLPGAFRGFKPISSHEKCIALLHANFNQSDLTRFAAPV